MIYLKHFSSIPLTKKSQVPDHEATFIGHDFGHKPEPLVFEYPHVSDGNFKRPHLFPPHSIVAVIANVVYKKGGIDDRYWNGKRGPSPSEEHFMKFGNR